MKRTLSVIALVALAFGCATTDRTITEPAGANRSWDPAEIYNNPASVPVNTSTDTDKHIWTQSPVPTVPPTHQDWRIY